LNEKIALAKIKLRGAQTKRQASIIARHFEIAGKPLMAFQYWIKAAQYARELFSKEEASNAFSRATQISIDHSLSISEEDLYTLFLEWGDMAFNLMDLPSLDECYSGMYEAGVQTNSQMLMGAGMNGLGLSAFFSMDLEKALFLLDQSIQILDKTDNLFEKVQGRYRYGMALSTIGQNERAIQIYDEAIKLGEGINSQRIRQAVTTVHNYKALLYAILGWPVRSNESGKAALRNAFLLVSKPTTQSAAYATLAIAEYYSGRFAESLNYVRQSKKLVENLRNPRILSLMLILESRLNTLQAKMDTGWDLACRALDLATVNNYIENISEAHCVRGDIYLTLHLYEEAINEYKIGNETMPGTHSGLDNLYRLGYTTAMNGDLDKGLQILKSSIELADQIQLGSISIPARYLSAQLLESNGKIDEAKEIFSLVIHEAEERGFSLKTIPGSIPRLRYLYEHLENSLAEQVISNLYSKGVIHPGLWIERLLANLTRNHLYSEQFDRERFFRFLRAPLQQ
jgi:tetratricopeptide (TPR) repeat protein